MIKIYNKSLRIKSEWIGEKVFIYNGKVFQRKSIHASMLGYKIGEFVLTKRLGGKIHIKESKKKKKNKKK
jgi:ribosomal protein S19